MNITTYQGNKILGILAMISGLVILGLTKYQNLQIIQSSKMGPGFFPTLCGIAIFACGIMILKEFRLNTETKEESGEGEDKTPIFSNDELKNLKIFIVSGVGVLMLAEYIGLLLSLGLCVVAYLKIQGKESWHKSVIIGGCMTVFLYLVFVLFLNVPVPMGFLEL